MDAFSFYTKISQFAVKERARLENQTNRHEPEWQFLEKCETIVRGFAKDPVKQVRLVREMGETLTAEHV